MSQFNSQDVLLQVKPFNSPSVIIQLSKMKGIRVFCRCNSATLQITLNRNQHSHLGIISYFKLFGSYHCGSIIELLRQIVYKVNLIFAGQGFKCLSMIPDREFNLPFTWSQFLYPETRPQFTCYVV